MIGIYKLTKPNIFQTSTFVFNMRVGEEVKVIKCDNKMKSVLLDLGKGAQHWVTEEWLSECTELVSAGIQIDFLEDLHVVQS